MPPIWAKYKSSVLLPTTNSLLKERFFQLFLVNITSHPFLLGTHFYFGFIACLYFFICVCRCGSNCSLYNAKSPRKYCQGHFFSQRLLRVIAFFPFLYGCNPTWVSRGGAVLLWKQGLLKDERNNGTKLLFFCPLEPSFLSVINQNSYLILTQVTWRSSRRCR